MESTSASMPVAADVPSADSSRRAYWMCALVGLGGLFAGVTGPLLSTFVPILVRDALGDHRAAIGAVMAIDNVLLLVLVPWAGIASDRASGRGKSRLPLVMAGYVLAAIGMAMFPAVAAFGLARRRQATTILNPAPARSLPPELVRLTDVLVPNEHEARQLLGRHVSIEDLASSLRRTLGFPAVVVTAAERGAWLSTEHGTTHHAAPVVEAVDSTGAGDVFVAALAGHAFRRHFIGALQSNKTRDAAELFDWVHTVDRLRIAERLSAQRPESAAPLEVCIQVRIGEESTKGGVAPAALAPLADSVATLPRLRLRGLMCLPPEESEPERQRRWFAELRRLAEGLNARGHRLDALSMGMSGDFEAAIAEGATHVRIGTAVFGARV